MKQICLHIYHPYVDYTSYRDASETRWEFTDGNKNLKGSFPVMKNKTI